MVLRTFFTLFMAGLLWPNAGCSPEIRTVSDVIRAGGNSFQNADYWQTSVLIRLNRPTHISEWEGVIYSDGDRYAALLNGASEAGQLQSHLVIDDAGDGWLRVTDSAGTRLLTFKPSAEILGIAGHDAFMLPGNPGTGNPLGMFLDPACALRTLDAVYDLQLTRRSQIQGEPVVGFSGSINPEALAEIDPQGYLTQHNLPIDTVDVTVRLYDGAPRRIQFLEDGIGYLLIEYYDLEFNPEPVETRFTMEAGDEQPVPVKSSAYDAIAGVNDDHMLFEWDETLRVEPRMN